MALYSYMYVAYEAYGSFLATPDLSFRVKTLERLGSFRVYLIFTHPLEAVQLTGGVHYCKWSEIYITTKHLSNTVQKWEGILGKIKPEPASCGINHEKVDRTVKNLNMQKFNGALAM